MPAAKSVRGTNPYRSGARGWPTPSSPTISAPPLNPTKKTRSSKNAQPTLQAIIPQKRTIEVTNQRANSMEENRRKIVATAKQSPEADGTPRRPRQNAQKNARKRTKTAR